MACVPVALRALRIFSSACVFSCVRCVFRCVKFLSLRILLRGLRILLRISLRNGLALRALRCVRRMEIGLAVLLYAYLCYNMLLFA